MRVAHVKLQAEADDAVQEAIQQARALEVTEEEVQARANAAAADAKKNHELSRMQDTIGVDAQSR